MTQLAQKMEFFGELSYSSEEGHPNTFARQLRELKVLKYKDLPFQDDQEIKEHYSKLSAAAGEFVNRDERDDGRPTEEPWIDIKYDPEKDYTYRHSNTRQPLHTDGAYTSYDFDVSFFFCLESAPIGGATTVFDVEDFLQILREYQPDLLEELTSTEVVFEKGETERNVSPILTLKDPEPEVNWNYYRYSKENSEQVQDLCERFHRFLENHIVDAGILTPVYLDKGEAVFFHDRKVLHGRNAFFGDRCLIKGGVNL